MLKKFLPIILVSLPLLSFADCPSSINLDIKCPESAPSKADPISLVSLKGHLQFEEYRPAWKSEYGFGRSNASCEYLVKEDLQTKIKIDGVEHLIRNYHDMMRLVDQLPLADNEKNYIRKNLKGNGRLSLENVFRLTGPKNRVFIRGLAGFISTLNPTDFFSAFGSQRILNNQTFITSIGLSNDSGVDMNGGRLETVTTVSWTTLGSDCTMTIKKN
jgi:hypothetical protein